MTTATAISVKNVSKQFHSHGRRIQALDDVSFNVPQGTVFAILGPNGAGKTTLLRIITTMLNPNTGTVTVEGHNARTEALQIRQHIGIVAQSSNFDRYLTVWDNLAVHAQMHGMEKDTYISRISDLLKKVGLYDRRNDYADELSGGMQRRIALIRALIHQPKVLFLDEPSTGLDPQARRDVWETIVTLKATTTIILTTHYMEEADELSDEILMINHGKVVMQGTPAELKRSVSPKNTYLITLNKPVASNYTGPLKNYTPTQESAYQLRITLSDPASLSKVVQQIDPADFHQIGAADADMEAVYLSLARKT